MNYATCSIAQAARQKEVEAAAGLQEEDDELSDADGADDGAMDVDAGPAQVCSHRRLVPRTTRRPAVVHRK